MERPIFYRSGIIEGSSHEKFGILECVRQATAPLTNSGEFYLEMLELETYQYETYVQLHSADMDILFRTTFLLDTSVQCFFNVHPVKKTFSAEFLFPATGIPIQLKKGEPSKGLFIKHYSPEKTKAQNEIENLLEGSGFIQELNRLCREIKMELPMIRDAFDAENIERTTALYSAEYQKSLKK